MPELYESIVNETLLTLARNVVLLRARRGLSQTRLASAAELSRATVSNIERAEGVPNLSVVMRLATVLEVPLSDLFTKEVAPTTASSEKIADLVAGRGSPGAVDARALVTAVDEAAGHSALRYSRAGRPRSASTIPQGP